MLNFLLILTNIFLAISGQTLIKKGVNQVGSFSKIPLLRFFKESIFSPLVALGLFLYLLSALVWFMVLSKVDLSVAYPTLSLGYILIILSGYFFLNEPITPTKVLGAIFICLGTLLIFKK